MAEDSEIRELMHLFRDTKEPQQIYWGIMINSYLSHEGMHSGFQIIITGTFK